MAPLEWLSLRRFLKDHAKEWATKTMTRQEFVAYLKARKDFPIKKRLTVSHLNRIISEDSVLKKDDEYRVGNFWPIIPSTRPRTNNRFVQAVEESHKKIAELQGECDNLTNLLHDLVKYVNNLNAALKSTLPTTWESAMPEVPMPVSLRELITGPKGS